MNTPTIDLTSALLLCALVAFVQAGLMKRWLK